MLVKFSSLSFFSVFQAVHACCVVVNVVVGGVAFVGLRRGFRNQKDDDEYFMHFKLLN